MQQKMPWQPGGNLWWGWQNQKPELDGAGGGAGAGNGASCDPAGGQEGQASPCGGCLPGKAGELPAPGPGAAACGASSAQTGFAPCQYWEFVQPPP